MLFTDSSKAQTAGPAVPTTAAKDKPAAVETANKILELADLAPKPATIPAPVSPTSKVTPIVQKPAPSSFEAEEVKIPAWLAPLANNSEPKSTPSTAAQESPAHGELAGSDLQKESTSGVTSSQNRSSSIQSEMFGGQLLSDSSAARSDAPSKSKKGLLIGVAAGLLIAGGVFWYSKQPGNILTGSAATIPAASQPANATSASASTNDSSAKPQTSIPANSVSNSANTSSASSSPSLTPAKQTTLSESNAPVSGILSPAVSKQPSEKPRSVSSVPAAPEPKKPVVGDVQLARPVVNGGSAARENGESSLSIDTNQPSGGENLNSLSGGRTNGPEAPLPVGGDVKPAQLIKSVPPVYPTLAKSQHISGNVQIDALIDASGNVSSMKVLSGPATLHQAALAAVKQWRYQPAELDGKPTSMHLTVTVQFRMQ